MAEYAWYKLNENAASTAVADSSGNERHGVASANTSVLAASGVIDGAFDFAGTYGVDCGHIANFTPYQDMSFACWVRYDGGTGQRVIIDHRDRTAGTNWEGFVLWGSSTQIGVYFYKHSASLYFSTIKNVSIYEWHHVALTMDRDGNMSLYIDATDAVTVDISARADADMTVVYPLRIGIKTEAISGFTPWPGLIDDVRIYDYVLPADQVSRLYNAGLGRQTSLFAGRLIQPLIQPLIQGV